MLARINLDLHQFLRLRETLALDEAGFLLWLADADLVAHNRFTLTLHSLNFLLHFLCAWNPARFTIDLLLLSERSLS